LAHIGDNGSAPLSQADVLSGFYAIDCLFYVSPSVASQVITQLQSQVLNTTDRLNAYAKSAASIGTQFYQLPTQQERSARCAVNPSTLPN
jgi:hypothetical protein